LENLMTLRPLQLLPRTVKACKRRWLYIVGKVVNVKGRPKPRGASSGLLRSHLSAKMRQRNLSWLVSGGASCGFIARLSRFVKPSSAFVEAPLSSTVRPDPKRKAPANEVNVNKSKLCIYVIIYIDTYHMIYVICINIHRRTSISIELAHKSKLCNPNKQFGRI
jgi:hypothetical protein